MAFAWCQTGSEADEEDGNQRSVPQAFAEHTWPCCLYSSVFAEKA